MRKFVSTLRRVLGLASVAWLAACGGGATLSLGPNTVEVGLDATLQVPEQGVSVSFNGLTAAGCAPGQPCGGDAAVVLTIRKDGGAASRVALPAVNGGPQVVVDGVQVTLTGVAGDAAAPVAVLTLQPAP